MSAELGSSSDRAGRAAAMATWLPGLWHRSYAEPAAIKMGSNHGNSAIQPASEPTMVGKLRTPGTITAIGPAPPGTGAA